MKLSINLIIICFSIFLTEPIKEMKPVLGQLIAKNEAGEKKFNAQLKQCQLIFAKDFKKLSKEELKIYNSCDETHENYWEILGQGCSWYCGGGLEKASASSCLTATKLTKYTAEMASDLSYQTAWVEGAPGYGIGETLTLDFPPENPRITDIIIVNGYVKSKKAWQENARVKKLKMYIDDKPIAILNLADSRQEQRFKFKPIGDGDRLNKNLKLKPHWRMKFEIMEVYPGEKYEDTAITEIYFDGIDVH